MAKTENAIWVVAQLENDETLGVTYELLGQARRLADTVGQNTAVILIARENNGHAEKLIAQGADVVYTVLGEEYADYNVELYTNAICELAQEYKPNGIMFGATIDGRDLAPRVAGNGRERPSEMDPACAGRQPDGHHRMLRHPSPDGLRTSQDFCTYGTGRRPSGRSNQLHCQK